jgi:NADPH:quinone reductase-like Zn-dependent oxidoreductase
MKAIAQQRYGEADVLGLQDLDDPKAGPGEVLVRVHAAGVDPGVWICMTGRPYLARLAFGRRRPKVTVRGRDLAGVVTAVGEGVTRFKPGDEVYGTTLKGSYAEFALAQEQRLARKPANASFAQAGAVPVSGQTALQAVKAGDVQAGQHVMVIGAGGGIGTCACRSPRRAAPT